MLSWLTVVWRHMLSDKLFTLITILSLSLGAMCAVLVGAYLQEELSYEAWLPDSENIYRLETSVTQSGQNSRPTVSTFYGMKTEFDGVVSDQVSQTRVAYDFFSIGENDDRETYRIAFADPNFFDVFEFNFIEGDPDTALADPNSLVLTETVSKRFFGDRSPIGETLDVWTHSDGVVTAVIADLPRETHLEISVISHIDNSAIRDGLQVRNGWNGLSVRHYFRTQDGQPSQSFEQNIETYAQQFLDKNFDKSDGIKVEFELMPIRNVHFSAAKSGDLKTRGNPGQLKLFTGVSIVILLASGLNFSILSIVRAMSRTREVGLRKALGASRARLLKDYLAEAGVYIFLSLLVGFAAAELFHPVFETLVGHELSLSTLHSPVFLILVAFVGIALVGVIGILPALYLSGLKPSVALRSDQKIGGSTVGNSLLLTIQFSAAIALVTAILIMFAQIRLIDSKPLGFEAVDRLAIYGVQRGPTETIVRLETLRTLLNDEAGILGISGVNALPDWGRDASGLIYPEGRSAVESANAAYLYVDAEFLKTFEIPIIAGRDFDETYASDRALKGNNDLSQLSDQLPVIITRAALANFGISDIEDIVGQSAGMQIDGVDFDIQIIGVTDDLNYKSLHYKAEPMVFIPKPGSMSVFLVHFDGSRHTEVMDALNAAWSRTYPNQNLNIRYIDAELAEQYDEDRQLLRLATAFAVLAIFVAILGAFGLSAFTIERRKREIGIRKALGAKGGDIAGMLAWQFVKPIIVACLIAWPLSWWFMSGWLQQFAYKVSFSPRFFIISGGIGVILAVLATGSQILRRAKTSPSIELQS